MPCSTPIGAARLVAAALVILVTQVFAQAAIAALELPPLTGRVMDLAELLTAAEEHRLSEKLARHEIETSNQMVVVTLPSLQGTTIEDFGLRLGRHWQIGQEGRNNGVLLIVAPQERKVRIEVGYGLEGVLPDAVAKAIIEREVLPAFRNGDFPQGITAGVDAVLAATTGSYAPSKKEGLSEEAQKYLLILFFLVIVIVPSMLLEEFGLGRQSQRQRWPGGGATGGHGSGGGFGGGGFSGGGGSFGGGGASGSW